MRTIDRHSNEVWNFVQDRRVKRFVCGSIFVAKIAEGMVRQLDFDRVSKMLLFELLKISDAFVELASDSSFLLANLS